MPEKRYVSPNDERIVQVRGNAREIVRQTATILYDIAIQDALSDVESPIEEIFAYALMSEIHRRWAGNRFASARDPLHRKKATHDLLVIVNQELLAGKYRGDFVVHRMGSKREDGSIAPAMLVVELDGHEFHERTKEQAAKDKRRDRELVAAGFSVIRFTGSEIWNDPFKCAEEAVDMALKVPFPEEDERGSS